MFYASCPPPVPVTNDQPAGANVRRAITVDARGGKLTLLATDEGTDVRVFESLAALRDATGEHLGYSDWHTVTQEQINAFADATGDHQWIHVDPEAAAKGPFGTTIAHGYLTLSLLPMFAVQVLRVDGLRMGVNYGLNKVRFPAPVPVGSAIRAGMKVLSVEDVGGGGAQVVTEVTIERDGGDKPCCVAQSVARYYA
jgi:acyl dehydratase